MTAQRPGILSLTSVFPNWFAPRAGLFIRARLEYIAVHADVKVIAPIPVLDEVRRKFTRGRVQCERTWHQPEALEVFHPRWLYVPGTGVITAFLLFIQLIRPARRIRGRFDVDILDAHFGYPEGIAAALLAALLKIPFIVTLRGSELLHGRYSLRKMAMRWAFQRASRVITVSEQLRDFAVELGVEKHRAIVIPNGIDSKRFYPRERAAMRIRHGLPVARPVLLTAGHLIELKGHHNVIRSVAGLRDRGIDVLLLIAGEPPGRGVANYEGALRQVTTELRLDDVVHFLGPVAPDSLAELMSAADVFCLASSREGWPNVVHEALGCGTPIVATRVGAIPDLVPSERYGHIVPVGDITALTEAIARALNTGWDPAAISSWAQSRSWEHVAVEVVKQIRQVLSEPQHRSQFPTNRGRARARI